MQSGRNNDMLGNAKSNLTCTCWGGLRLATAGHVILFGWIIQKAFEIWCGGYLPNCSVQIKNITVRQKIESFLHWQWSSCLLFAGVRIKCLVASKVSLLSTVFHNTFPFHLLHFDFFPLLLLSFFHCKNYETFRTFLSSHGYFSLRHLTRNNFYYFAVVTLK